MRVAGRLSATPHAKPVSGKRENAGRSQAAREETLYRPIEANMRKLIFAAAALTTILGGMGDAVAQTYPLRPVMMIVPLATGGSTDTIARIMAEGMRSVLGQPVIVEDVTGAGGSIGVGRIARS